MRNLLRFGVCVLAFIVVAHAAGEEARPSGRRRGMPALYDTVEVLKDADTLPTLVEEGKWVRIAAGAPPHAFKGDALLLNDKLAVVVRKDGSGVELYARGAEAWHRRGRLVPVAGKESRRFGAVKVVSGDSGAPAVEAKVQGVDGGAIVFSLKEAGLPAVKATTRGPVEALRIMAPCRLGVLPDFFADDLMIDARKIPIAHTEIPSDNFFLHMLADGSSILAAVWEKNVKDVEVSLVGEGEQRLIAATDVFFGSGGSIWTAVLEHENIWYSREFTREQGIKGGPLDWDVPFLAKWKGNFTREDGLVASERFYYPKEGWHPHAIERKAGKLTAHMSPVRDLQYEWVLKEYVGLQGVMVAYPISRLEETPLEQFCVDDLMRNCLGTQACAYILDVSGRQIANKGVFTCSYGWAIPRMIPPQVGDYYTVAAERMKEERAFIRQQNEQVLIFIKHIQNRINDYVDFSVEMLKYLEEQEKKHPDQSEFIAKLKNQLTKKIRMYGGKLISNTTKADGEERANGYLEEVYKALQVDTPEQARKALEAIPMVPHKIGDPQDLRVATFRRRVKLLRAMATMEMATNPAAADIAKEVRKRTEAVLRGPAGYEKATVW